MLIVYLPKEKILAEPDAFTPPPQAGTPLIPLGTHMLRGIASPCAVFTLPEN